MLFEDIHESFQPELSDYKVYALNSWEHDKNYLKINLSFNFLKQNK